MRGCRQPDQMEMRHDGFMSLRVVLLTLCIAFGLHAQMEMNVQQLVEFIRSELALHQHSDKQIAAYVKKLKLSEKLPDKVILDLEAQGAQPKTVQALQELRDETGSLKKPAQDVTSSPATSAEATVSDGPASVRLSSKAAPIPPPDSVRQQQMLDRIREYAMTYTQSLPNFICIEVMRRYVDPTRSDSYRSLGTVLAKVSYNEGQEAYKVYSVNGHFEEVSMERAGASGGAISTGEFGSMMREVFEPKSAADFGWDHWATLRGRRMAVFNYSISSAHSSYSISYSAGPGDEQHIITAYKGQIYADENTGEIARIRFVAVDIPRSFPVTETSEVLDYDLVEISGQKYVCPLSAKLLMTAGRERTKNELEFRDYRKFGTESNIKYDLDPSAPPPPPLPPSKTEEQPATASPGPNDGASKGNPKSSTSDPWAIPSAPPPPPTAPPE